jgi:N-acetyl-gamma-glutamyl-phosphate reductase
VEITALCGRSAENKRYGEVYGNFSHMEYICKNFTIDECADISDVVFIALPHGVSSSMMSRDVLKKAKVIDLGADYRIRSQAVYEEWYAPHETPELLPDAVYGLCELYRDEIKNAQFIANPGCYPTCSILSLYPLVKEGLINKDSIIIDAKSGQSGAGRAVSLETGYCEINESIKAYKPAVHRHIPEVEQELSAQVVFVPHLVPMNRGILITAYAALNGNVSKKDVTEVYAKYYSDEKFVRLINAPPETKWVEGSNYCDISFTIDERSGRIIVMGAIDNLVKGAAGQAVQNMNIMHGLDEGLGISSPPMFP